MTRRYLKKGFKKIHFCLGLGVHLLLVLPIAVCYGCCPSARRDLTTWQNLFLFQELVEVQAQAQGIRALARGSGAQRKKKTLHEKKSQFANMVFPRKVDYRIRKKGCGSCIHPETLSPPPTHLAQEEGGGLKDSGHLGQIGEEPLLRSHTHTHTHTDTERLFFLGGSLLLPLSLSLWRESCVRKPERRVQLASTASTASLSLSLWSAASSLLFSLADTDRGGRPQSKELLRCLPLLPLFFCFCFCCCRLPAFFVCFFRVGTVLKEKKCLVVKRTRK